MEKKLLFLFLFSFCTFHLYSQDWAEIGSKWYYTYWWYSPNTLDVLEVEVIGDTIIQGQNCRVFRQNSGIASWDIPCSPAENYMYEDEGVIYYFDGQQQSFVKLYDFNVIAGEFWQVWFCQDFCSGFDSLLTVYIDSVSTEDISGLQIKTQHAHWESPQQDIPFKIYEGFGSSQRMFVVEPNCFTGDVGIVELRCFYSPTLGEVNFTNSGSCSSIVGTSNHYFSIKTVRLYPNPTSGQISIELAKPLSNLGSWSLYNAFGQKVFSHEIERGISIWEVRLPNIASGVYFWELEKEKQIMENGRLMMLR